MNLRPAHLLHKYLIFTQFNAHKALMRNKLGKLSPDIRGRWLDIGAGDQPYRKFFNITVKKKQPQGNGKSDACHLNRYKPEYGDWPGKIGKQDNRTNK